MSSLLKSNTPHPTVLPWSLQGGPGCQGLVLSFFPLSLDLQSPAVLSTQPFSDSAFVRSPTHPRLALIPSSKTPLKTKKDLWFGVWRWHLQGFLGTEDSLYADLHAGIPPNRAPSLSQDPNSNKEQWVGKDA